LGHSPSCLSSMTVTAVFNTDGCSEMVCSISVVHCGLVGKHEVTASEEAYWCELCAVNLLRATLLLSHRLWLPTMPRKLLVQP
jgi:hypothetical protein